MQFRMRGLIGVDWQPLAGGDPIPGDPEAISALASTLRNAASELDSQVQTLRGLGDSGTWEGDAGSVFRSKQQGLTDLFSQLATRYELVASPLATFATQLDDAQQQARSALSIAQPAHSTLTQASQGLEEQSLFERQQQTAAASGGVPQPWSGPDWLSIQDGATANLSRANSMLNDAEALRDAAAVTSANSILNAIQDGLKNDTSIWGDITRTCSHVAQFISDHLPLSLISEICNALSAICGILALIPGLEFMVIPALIFAGGALLADSILLVAGKGDWVKVAFDVLSVATFGIGKVFSLAADTSTASRASSMIGEIKSGATPVADLTGALSKDGVALSGAAARSTTLKQLPEVIAEAKAPKSFLDPGASVIDQWRNISIAGLPPISTSATRILRAGVVVNVVSTVQSAVGSVHDLSNPATPIHPWAR